MTAAAAANMAATRNLPLARCGAWTGRGFLDLDLCEEVLK
jgi:hypothetical protein